MGTHLPGGWEEASLAHWVGLKGSLAPGSHASSPHWGSLLGPCPTHWPWPPLPPPVPPIRAASSDACNSPTQAGEAEASLQATL